MAALFLTSFPALAFAQNPRLDTGYSALATQLGVALPTGAAVAVTQVEASFASYDIDDPNEADPNKVIRLYPWKPSDLTMGSGDFAGVTFDFRSPAPPIPSVPPPTIITGTQNALSGHAVAVGANFYGDANSFSPGISNVHAYEANNWINSGSLNGGQVGVLPNPTQNLSRVANHSYVGSLGTPTATVELLQRIDFLVERDDMINVVGMNNGSNGTIVASNGTLIGSNSTTIFSYAANTISVGTSALGHVNGTPVLLDGLDVYGRSQTDSTTPNYREHPRPDLVAPAGATSFATPLVSSAAALLIDASRAHGPSAADPWSNVSYNAPRMIDPNPMNPTYKVYAADTSEVIRAALMAGADRKFFNSDGVKALDYRAASANQAPNGLDRRYGAGQLNVRNSYDVLAGKQHSVDPITNAVTLLPTDSASGFDYDPSFGGFNGSNSVAKYNFTGAWTGQNLAVSLVWNVGIDTDNDNFYFPNTELYNLNLRLLDITGTPVEIASSMSGFENTENIFTTLQAGRLYQLEVSSPNAGTFEWDYGIAWNGSSNQVWRGTVVDNNWNVNSSTNWQRGNNATTTFLNNDQVVFTDLALNKNVNIAAPVTPDFVTVNSTADYTFSGSAITGPGGLFKDGIGTLFLNNNNTYTGGTYISAGRLVVNGSVTGPVEVQSAGTLGGNGTITGNVLGTGTVAPGNSIGTLHIAGAYNITGTNDFEISKVGSTLTNDLVDQITALTYDGILKITTIAGSDAATTFVPGNAWDLFNFTGTPTGLFDNNSDFGMLGGGGGNLPTLNSNYAWDFNYSTGVLSVIPEPGTWFVMLCVGVGAIAVRGKKRRAN